MYLELTSEQKNLSDFMSEISESAYAAQWMINLEYVLWTAVLNGPRNYGRHLITQCDIDKLIQFSTDANCWIHFDDETEDTAISIDEWNEKYNEFIKIIPNKDML